MQGHTFYPQRGRQMHLHITALNVINIPNQIPLVGHTFETEISYVARNHIRDQSTYKPVKPLLIFNQIKV